MSAKQLASVDVQNGTANGEKTDAAYQNEMPLGHSRGT